MQINVPMILFLLLPPLAFAARARWRPKLSVWWLACASVVLGWLLATLAVEWHFAYLESLVKASPDPSPDLLDRLQSDGATRVFTFLLGWLYAGVYFGLWAGCVSAVSRIVKKHDV